MAVKGEAAPVCDLTSHMQGRTVYHKDRPMISFMISLVPP
jgi:hypothetical protein